MVEVPEKIKKNTRISVDAIAIGKIKANKNIKNVNGTKVEVPVLTLQEAMSKYNEENHEITYLKLDIDGAEFSVGTPEPIAGFTQSSKGIYWIGHITHDHLCMLQISIIYHPQA